MKKSYLKILILVIILIFIMLIDIFIINKINNFTLLGIIIIGMLSLNILLGSEKNNYRYAKDTILIILIGLIIGFILFYALGLLTGYVKVDNYLSTHQIITFVIPIILNIIVVEIFRSNLLKKSEGSKKLVTLVTIFFIITDLVLIINPITISSTYNIFVFIACFVLPSIIKNIFCSYLCCKVGYKPTIVYRIITELYVFLFPIVPNVGDYINAMFKIILPSILLYILYNNLNDKLDEELSEIKNTKKNKIINGILIGLVAIVIYLTSGNFTYYIVAVGSGSMKNLIHKGDIVVIKKLKESEKENVELGNILAYKYNDITIVHRIVDIYEKDDFIVYTKGDANDKIDNYPIDKSMMKGIVKIVIPIIGYPTIWISEHLT